MQGLTVVVVGGGAGLGASIMEMAVEAGAVGVGVIDVNPEAADAALAPARAAGLPGVAAACDIRTAEAAHRGFAEVAAGLGRVDTLVSSAGEHRFGLVRLERDQREGDVSHDGSRRCGRCGGRRGGGCCGSGSVNVASVDAFKAHPQNAHYAATKAAVVSPTKNFAWRRTESSSTG